MNGTGVYGLYYIGDYEPYAPIAEKNRRNYSQPIYIGQAARPGTRTGITTPETGLGGGSGSVLARLHHHAGSIRAARNLRPEDFSCRFIFLIGSEHDIIGAVETGLIRAFRPLWNSRVVEGFGNHDPGNGRYNQQPSPWDTLHPGRSWAEKLTGTPKDPQTIIASIREYLVHPRLTDLIVS